MAQIMEFNRTTQDFFMSDANMAKMFGVSDKTISRALKVLEDKGLIERDTKNKKGGKERHIKVCMIDASKDKMSVVQGTNCLLYKGQNDLIKDNNEKINIKDNGVMNQPQVADCITLQDDSRSKQEVVREVMNNSTSQNGKFKF